MIPDFNLADLDALTFGEDPDGFEHIEDRFLEPTRWGYRHQVVFRFEGIYYGFTYEYGAGDSEIDFEPSAVYHVLPKQVVTTLWRKSEPVANPKGEAKAEEDARLYL